MPNNIPPPGTKEYLVALRDTTGSILKGQSIGPVTITACFSVDTDGSEWCVVTIRAPHMTHEEKMSVHDELATAGFKDVEVRTEW